MGIEITSVKLKDVRIERDNNKSVMKGTYELISSKGIVIAKQDFNGYSDIVIPFEASFVKNIVSDVEEMIEIEIGIQKAVKAIKGGS